MKEGIYTFICYKRLLRNIGKVGNLDFQK
jgi:hypothetical protein